MGEPLDVTAEAGSVCGAEPSPQLTTTEPSPVVKSATVATGLASVKVAMTTLPVLFPSMPVIDVPEAVIGASATVTAAAGGLDSVVVAPPRVVIMTLESVWRAAGRLGVGVAAEHLEDRCPDRGRRGVTPISWTTSEPGTVAGVPSPQPSTARP